MLTEIQILKRKDKKIKKSLVTILIELILIKKISMIIKNLHYIAEPIKNQTEESTKKSLINDLSKRP